MSDNDDHYRDAMLEEMRDLLRGLNEGLADVPADVRQLKQDVGVLKADMTEVKSDIRVIKLVLTDHSGTLSNHESRIARLEQKAA